VQQIFKQGTYLQDWSWHVCYPNSDVDELRIGMQVPADGQNTGCCSYQPDKEVVTYINQFLSNLNTYFFVVPSPTAMHWCKKCFSYSNALVQEMFPYSNALVQEMFLMQRQPHYKQETSPPNTSLMFQGFQHFFQFLYL
jgi:hypothetical protein